MRHLMLAIAVIFLTSCTTTTIVKGPYSGKVNKQKEVESRVQIALIYLQDKEPEKAIKQLETAMDVDPKSARVHEVLALSLEQVSDFKRANKNFKQMLSYDKKYTRGRTNYGSYLMRRGEYGDALKQFAVVVEDIYYPRRAVVYLQMAECSKQLGKQDDMLAYYKKAAELDSNYAPPLLELAKNAFDKKDYPTAQQYFDQYRKKVKQSSADALLLGIKLARVFQDRDAEASYTLALKNLYPHSKEYLEYLDEQKQ